MTETAYVVACIANDCGVGMHLLPTTLQARVGYYVGKASADTLVADAVECGS